MGSDQTTIRFRLEPASGLAPFRQLVDQVRQAVALGSLVPGDRLPSVREVVGQVTINPNTVQRAYRELEHEGIIEARPGLGTFVAARAESAVSTSAVNDLLEALRAWVERARVAGLDDAGVVALVALALRGEEEVPAR
ncbi:MAG TPA: GntR family transcriptional regulator [Acidimicrobiales bacterium]|nr:GntR family transcriptional regulator [Acidimicrobiales bacterium]